MDPSERPGNRNESGLTLPRTRLRRQADDWALVLRAEGVPHEILRADGGFWIQVASADLERTHALLEAWELERAERADRLRPVPVRSATSLEVACAYALALSLLAFHLGLEASGVRGAWIELGASEADRVMRGELARLVTALTLHSDLPHVIGNTLFGGFFLAMLAGRLGIGLATLAFLVTGTLGNLANVLYYTSHHSSIGASTGVFGLVGVLTGLAAWRRHRTAGPGRGAWVAFAAGLGIVSMLGTGGPRVDVSAHLFGLGAGALAGLAIAYPLSAGSKPPGLPAQIAALFTVGITIAVAWQRVFVEAG